MERSLASEWLDALPAHDRDAARSRQDLDRLNGLMGNARTVARALQELLPESEPAALAELGAGDGRFMLRVARRLSRRRPGGRVLLLDRNVAAAPEVGRALAALAWSMKVLQADVFDWLRAPATEMWRAMVANLFLHHFREKDLVELLGLAAERTRGFVAVEPRRSVWALTASCLVGVLGSNRVTRHDAPVSVRAGFSGSELSRLWPAEAGWSLQEGPAGPFSHLFIARRRS